MALRTIRECACVCVYMHVCQGENKYCMLVSDEAVKDSALTLPKKTNNVQSKIHRGEEKQPDGSLSY